MQTYLKTKPAFTQFLLFFGMALGVFLVFGTIGGNILSKITGINLLQSDDISNWPTTPNMIVFLRGMLLIQFLGLFVVPPLLFAYFSDPEPLQYLGLKKPSKAIYWILGVAIMLLAVPLVEYTGVINKAAPFGQQTRQWMQGLEEQAARQIQFMIKGNSVSNLILNLVFIALFAGVGEELLFRGILQRLFIRGTNSPWLGIIITAFLFSAIHFQFFGFIPRFLLGILLGAIYWYSGSLLTAMLAHFVYDAFFITLAFYQPQIATDADATLFEGLPLPLLALISAAVVTGLVFVMKKASSTSFAEVYKDDFQPLDEDLTF